MTKTVTKVMKTTMPMLLLALSSTQALAHDGNDSWVTAKDYQLWSNTYTDEHIRVVPSDGMYNPAGEQCSDLDSYMVDTSLPEPVKQRIYSTLLSAVMAKRSVKLRLDSSSCENLRPKIITVVIQ